MTAQTEVRSAPTPTRKDIFISYSRRDKAWVDDYLTRLLKAADISYAIDEEDIAIGGLLDESIQKMVNECPVTLLVMTDDWVRGKWTHYESMLAVEEGLNRRVLPIQLKDCQVPPHIAPRLYLDLRNARERDQKIVRLLKDLHVSEAGIEKALGAVATRTLQWLIELMDDPKVREEVSQLRDRFEQIRSSYRSVSSQKGLHDRLQDVQQSVNQVVLSCRQRDEGIAWEQLRKSVLPLRRNLRLLLGYAEELEFEPVDLAFVFPMRLCVEDLQVALNASDSQHFLEVVDCIQRTTNQELPRVNERIVQKLRERPLETLSEGMQEFYELVKGGDFEFDQDATDLLREIEGGIEKLVEFDQAMREHVADHSILQMIEVQLNIGDPAFDRIRRTWKYTEPLVRKLELRTRYPELFSLCDRLCQLLSDTESVRDDRFEASVERAFVELKEELIYVFNMLDIDLLRMCGKLEDHEAELHEIIGRMQNHETRT